MLEASSLISGVQQMFHIGSIGDTKAYIDIGGEYKIFFSNKPMAKIMLYSLHRAERRPPTCIIHFYCCS